MNLPSCQCVMGLTEAEVAGECLGYLQVKDTEK